MEENLLKVQFLELNVYFSENTYSENQFWGVDISH